MLLLAEQIDHGCLEGIFTKSSLTEVRPSWRCTLELRTSCVSAVGTGQIAIPFIVLLIFFFFKWLIAYMWLSALLMNLKIFMWTMHFYGLDRLKKKS